MRSLAFGSCPRFLLWPADRGRPNTATGGSLPLVESALTLVSGPGCGPETGAFHWAFGDRCHLRTEVAPDGEYFLGSARPTAG